MSQKVKWINFPITRHEKQLLRRHTFVRHLCYTALVVLPISSGFIHEIDFWLINSRVRVCRHDSHNSTRSTILRICQPSMTDSCLNHNNNNIVYVSPDWTVQKRRPHSMAISRLDIIESGTSQLERQWLNWSLGGILDVVFSLSRTSLLLWVLRGKC